MTKCARNLWLGFDKILHQLRWSSIHGSRHSSSSFRQNLTPVKLFWPRMSRDVQVWCAACRQCQQWKGPSRKKRTALQIWLSHGPWDKVFMDILGPLPRTARKNKYILVVMDTFTKFVEAFPIPDLEAQDFHGRNSKRNHLPLWTPKDPPFGRGKGRFKPRWWRPCMKPWAFRSLEPPLPPSRELLCGKI